MDGTWDVVVVGGGPAGATVSGLLARSGHRVLVLEREKFPRYHIGESLVPGVLPVLKELGLEERYVAAADPTLQTDVLPDREPLTHLPSPWQ